MAYQYMSIKAEIATDKSQILYMLIKHSSRFLYHSFRLERLCLFPHLQQIKAGYGVMNNRPHLEARHVCRDTNQCVIDRWTRITDSDNNTVELTGIKLKPNTLELNIKEVLKVPINSIGSKTSHDFR